MAALGGAGGPSTASSAAASPPAATGPIVHDVKMEHETILMLRTRVLLAGDAAVGKTALAKMFASGSTDYPRNYVMVRSLEPLRFAASAVRRMVVHPQLERFALCPPRRNADDGDRVVNSLDQSSFTRRSCRRCRSRLLDSDCNSRRISDHRHARLNDLQPARSWHEDRASQHAALPRRSRMQLLSRPY